MNFHEWMKDSWVVFFSHPKDFTPICTTELGLMARMESEFAKRNTKIVGHSIDTVEEHHRWIHDIKETQGFTPHFPIIGDSELIVAKLYDMLPADAQPGVRTAADNATVRAVFIIGPDRKIKLQSYYPATVGRSFDEVLRSLDSLQLTAKFNVVTPANWKRGDDVIIPTAVSNEQAAVLFPGGWEERKPYLRIVPQPTEN
jgi:thioredoxin-dependent peroxiredoxin